VYGVETYLCNKMRIEGRKMTCWEIVRDIPCPHKNEVTPEFKEVLLGNDKISITFYIKEEV
jgi:hypothetical protein